MFVLRLHRKAICNIAHLSLSAKLWQFYSFSGIARLFETEGEAEFILNESWLLRLCVSSTDALLSKSLKLLLTFIAYLYMALRFRILEMLALTESEVHFKYRWV